MNTKLSKICTGTRDNSELNLRRESNTSKAEDGFEDSSELGIMGKWEQQAWHDRRDRSQLNCYLSAGGGLLCVGGPATCQLLCLSAAVCSWACNLSTAVPVSCCV